MVIPKLTDVVKGDQKVKFVSLKNKELWYVTESGFEFSVPLHDTDGAEFLAEDKAIYFMRWIGRRIQDLRQAQTDFDSAI